jgi:hypothetical protein
MQPNENYPKAKEILEKSQQKIPTADAARTQAATANIHDASPFFDDPYKRFEYNSDDEEGRIPFGFCSPL